MLLQKRTGPPTRGKRAPQKRASWPAARHRHRATVQEQQDAERGVREMVAAGAVFRIDHTIEHGWFYRYDVSAAGDRRTCEGIVQAARAMPDPYMALFRVAVFVEIMRKRMGLEIGGRS